MSAKAPRVPIEKQIEAVAMSAHLAHASIAHRGEKDAPMEARADALDAAVATLRLVKRHAPGFRALILGATGDKPAADRGEHRLATQAAMRCNDPLFQKFLRVENADDAARAVRNACRVESRKELDMVLEAGGAWRRLDAEFLAWRRGDGE